MNFLEENEINLAYFLLNSRKKVSGNVHRRIQFIDNTMYLHGLVKILVELHLQNIGDNWERFLVRNHFHKETHGQPNRNKPKMGRKRKIDKAYQKEAQQPKNLSEDDIPLTEVLEKMNKRNVRRKKAIKETEIPSQVEKPKTKKKKIQKTHVIDFEKEYQTQLSKRNTLKEHRACQYRNRRKIRSQRKKYKSFISKGFTVEGLITSYRIS